MENSFYILNTKTDESFDTNENRFYPAAWEPVLEEKQYLQNLIDADPKKFEDCTITDINN